MIELLLDKESGRITRRDTEQQVDIHAFKIIEDEVFVPEDDTCENYCRFILDNDNENNQLSEIPKGFDAYYFIKGNRTSDKILNKGYQYNVEIMYTEIRRRGGVMT